MKIAVLDSATLGQDIDPRPYLEPYGSVEVYARTAPEERAVRCRGAAVAVANKVVFDRELMEQLPELKLICVAATGTNNVDIPAAGRLGIAVTNVAGYSTSSVVQQTIAMVLHQSADLFYYHDFVQSGAYARSGLFTCLERPFDQLAGQQWGIIGLGTIGRGVARVAEALGCRVVWSSASGSQRSEPWPQLPLKTLLKESDIVSIHAPLTEETRGLIGAEELALMQPHARLCNTGRGGIVDERALVEALDRGRPGRASLDVFSGEPLAADSPLLQINDSRRLLLTPHIAWSSRTSRRALLEGIAANIGDWLQGGRRNRVD